MSWEGEREVGNTFVSHRGKGAAHTSPVLVTSNVALGARGVVLEPLPHGQPGVAASGYLAGGGDGGVGVVAVPAVELGRGREGSADEQEGEDGELHSS